MKQTKGQLEWALIYSCIVAGKSAVFADGVMHRLFGVREAPWNFSPIGYLGSLGVDGIERELRRARSGNYSKLTRCFSELAAAKLDLLKCTPTDLENIHGIGPKTSRFFILWTRPGERYAALDVHVLRWLKAKGYPAPKSTPSGALYASLEASFISEADKRGMTARELDFEIWNKGSNYEPAAPAPKE